jgi:YbgC/YbaW family acyl-CoA thioester hydrolase
MSVTPEIETPGEPRARLSGYRLCRRVLFHETDSAGVVHFSCFFRYMEEAEHAMWRAAGLTIYTPGSSVHWPRVSAACDFRQPLRFEDEFEIDVRIAAIGTRTLRYACQLEKGGEIVATGGMTIVCVRAEAGGPMRAMPLPPEVLARFEVHP